MSAINSTVHDAVQNSSSEIIREHLSRMSLERFAHSRWLRQTNRYAKRTVEKIRAENAKAPIRPNEMIEYIAASSVLHCSDGWSFFSTAVENLINGDTPTSVFMAYYAQLRAVMSFFACEGIGIFNTKHFWFDNTGKCSFIRGATHEFARDLMNDWASEPTKNSNLLELLQFDNRRFSEWLAGAQIQFRSPMVGRLAREWLKIWSIDLGIMNKDHDIRNESSYRPQRIFCSTQTMEFDSSVKALLDILRASEPAGSNRFSLLDKHLLRETVSNIFRSKRHKSVNSESYAGLVTKMMVDLGMNPNGHLFEFLTFQVDPEPHPVLLLARKPGILKDGSIDALPVLARAYILLRIASAAVQNQLNDTGIGKDQLEFWWNPLGKDLGYWIQGNHPEDMADLWSDMEPSIEALQGWLVNNPDPHLQVFHNDLPFEIKQTTQFSKVCFWGIGL